MKKNDIVCIVRYARVNNVGSSYIDVTDLDDRKDFSVIGKELVDSLLSADSFDSTESITLTEMAIKLTESINVPFTVTFVKSNGDIRVLRGRMIKPEPILGRCHVLDFDVDSGSPLRLVDNRTLKELIVKGVKYVLKK